MQHRAKPERIRLQLTAQPRQSGILTMADRDQKAQRGEHEHLFRYHDIADRVQLVFDVRDSPHLQYQGVVVPVEFGTLPARDRVLRQRMQRESRCDVGHLLGVRIMQPTHTNPHREPSPRASADSWVYLPGNRRPERRPRNRQSPAP